MQKRSLVPNSVTYGCLLDACVKNSDLKRAKDVFECMRRDRVPMNTVIFTTMIKAHSKEWMLNEAISLYEQMLEEMVVNPAVAPNTITYNSIIDVCVKCFRMDKATEIFYQMFNGNAVVRPDLITYSTMIKGFCREKNIESALELLNTMQNDKIKADEVLYNSLLDGCCKANQLDLAFKVYENMHAA
jgi:pentatricopeptide repeat protein